MNSGKYLKISNKKR